MFKRAVASGLALLGLISVHDLSYLIVGGDAKGLLLAETGHTWYKSLPILIVVAFCAVLFGSLGAKGSGGRVSLLSVLGLQVISYNAIEVMERAAHGLPVMPSFSLLLVSTLLHLPVSFILLLIYNFTLEIFARLLIIFRSFLPISLSGKRLSASLIFFLSKEFLHSISPRSPPKNQLNVLGLKA